VAFDGGIGELGRGTRERPLGDLEEGISTEQWPQGVADLRMLVGA
jgi:hypothetical protein